MASPGLSLVVPFYNEEEGCAGVTRRLVDTLDEHRIDYELLAVDNGSVDKTGAVLSDCARAHTRIRVVTVERNQGYGWGILSGFAHGTGRYIGYVDGDTQVPPRAIVEVFERLRRRQADLCKGRRTTRQDGVRRKIISGAYNRFFNVLFSCPVTDVNAKPKIMTRACYEQLRLGSKDWFIDAEIVLKAHALGLRIEEVEIEFLARERGVSKVRVSTMLEFLKNLLRYRMTAKKNRQLLSPPPSRHARRP